LRRVYLDHTAGMPVEIQVIEAMRPYFNKFFSNPSSLHSFAREVREEFQTAREKVARLIGAKSEEIFFTSCATESNNWALRGFANRNKEAGKSIISTAIEHMSVINVCKYLMKKGFRVSFAPVDRDGVVNLDALQDSITRDTILISVMYANGEIGTVEPIREIAEIAHDKGVHLHTDATACAGQIPIDVAKDDVDLLTLSSNDMYGPKGVGAVFIKRGVRVGPLIFGGGQEQGLRSGTENIPGIIGMGKAAEIANSEMVRESSRLINLRDMFIKRILESVPYSFLNGHPTKRLPNNVATRFSFIEGESILLNLDIAGIAASSGSACTTKTLEPSHVLRAIGLKHEEAHGSLLFTLGKQNNGEEVDYVMSVLPDIVKRLRSMSPLTPEELRDNV
jgi:cysteine desulfurase